jgi:RimJ/RimL family protein N-acetyltransferase
MCSRNRTPADVEIVEVTSADRVDLREVAAMGILSWGREPGAAEVERIASALAGELAALDATARGIFVAQTSSAPVGFCRVVRDEHDATHWWLMGIAVHPEHRRRGVGTGLVRVAIAYARARGAKVIRSETHRVNAVSIRFHEGIGFRNDGDFIAPDGDEKVAFSLSLKDATPECPASTGRSAATGGTD